LDKDRSDHRKQLVRVRQAFGILRQLMRNTVELVNSPQFARHLSVSQNGDQRGVYEQQAISRRVQD